MFQREAKLPGVKIDRAGDVICLVPHAVKISREAKADC